MAYYETQYVQPIATGGGTPVGPVVVPVSPATPDQPSASSPGSPSAPASPDHPAHPVHPAHPTHPDHPVHPAHPAHPTKGIGCPACAGIGAYEAYVLGRTRMPIRQARLRLPQPLLRISGLGVSPVAVSGVGDSTTPSQLGTFLLGAAFGAGTLWLISSVLYEGRARRAAR